MHLLGRRNFLAGMGLGAGAHLLGSIFKRILPEAQGAAAPAKKRFFLFTFLASFASVNYRATALRSETDFDLVPEVWGPLLPYKKDLLVLSQFYNPYDLVQHGNMWALLSVWPSTKPVGTTGQGSPGGVSLDRFLASKLGAGYPFDSTLICTESDRPGPTGTGIFTPFSSDARDRPFPPVTTPIKAYETYIGKGVVSGGPNIESLLAEERSLFDLVRGDIARMSARLAATEKAKLDQYLTSLRGLEQQLGDLARSPPATCKALPAPAGGAFYTGISTARLEASVDVTFHAHLCGMTPVSYIGVASAAGEAHLSCPGVGNVHFQHHSHSGGQQAEFARADIKGLPGVRMIDAYNFRVMARLIKALADTPDEGGGRMLDNSLVMYLNTGGGRHHHGQNEHPVVLAGGAGGALRTGRYLTYPGPTISAGAGGYPVATRGPDQHCLSDVYVSVANALGVPITTFGDPKHCRGPLPGLA